MSTIRALNPVLTRAGMRALFAASRDGLNARITHIAFGDRSYAPGGLETRLHHERVRIPVAGGRYVSDYEIEIAALLEHDAAFTVAEVGIYLDDGTLLAIWSDPDTPLAHFMPGVPIVLSYALGLSAAPPGVIEIAGDLDLNLFFGGEFARLGAGVMSVAVGLVQAGDRIDVVERALEGLTSARERADRLEAALAQGRAREEKLLALIMRVGDLALQSAVEAI